jgi:protein-S-isoprenylcysteine O-methyltransferase Ste14
MATSVSNEYPVPDFLLKKRTKSQKKGLGKLLFDLCYRRRRSRQLVGALLVFLLTFVAHPSPSFLWLGVGFSTAGMLVRLWASGFVMKNEVLATSGPYGLVRHPLYVGNILIAVGFCFAAQIWWGYLLSLAMLFFYYPQTIKFEDHHLRNIFRESWDVWASETKALWPRISRYSKTQDGASWTLKRSMMRNGEPLHILILGGCLLYIYFYRVI